MRKIAALLGLALAPLLLAGCSFNRHWKEAQAQPAPADNISGAWEGRWLSAKNGHTGRLRCVMTQTGTNTYNARFHAIFWKIFRASYEVPFTATNQGTHFNFSGQSDLGGLGGGIYTYTGEATPAKFSARYQSKYDHGDFSMQRPVPKK